MELCLPIDGRLAATWWPPIRCATRWHRAGRPQLTRGQEVAFTEADGTRLALHGSRAARHARVHLAAAARPAGQHAGAARGQLARRARPVPQRAHGAGHGHVDRAGVGAGHAGRDTRRRLRVEQDLADALAFRKAMEDSVVTGLRARDLQGRITYVNPAFCEMVGFSPEELLAGNEAPGPRALLAARAGRRIPAAPDPAAGRQRMPPREGFESVFMRKDGTRFPVLIIEAPLINAHKAADRLDERGLDISEQRRIEELSRASQERLQATARLATVGEMASLLSHELNQPLAAIASYATGSLNLLRPARQGRPGRPADGHAAHRRAGRPRRPVIKSVHDFVRRRDQARARRWRRRR
jgi:two-component system sensor histidine kinase DctS